MERLRNDRRAAFRLGSAISSLDHHMTSLFDARDYDFSALHGFEIDLDVIDESIFSLAESNERGLVIEMQQLIRRMRDFFGSAYEGLTEGREPLKFERVKTFEIAGRIESLSFLLARQGEHLLALYRFGAAIAAARTLAALGEGENGDAWIEAKVARESLSPSERTLALEAFSMERSGGEHLIESFVDRSERFGWQLSKLDWDEASLPNPSASGGGIKPPRQRAVNEDRNRWCYEQLFSKNPHKEILTQLKQLAPSRGWAVITTPQALRSAARSHYLTNGLDPFPPRKGL